MGIYGDYYWCDMSGRQHESGITIPKVLLSSNILNM